MRVERPAFARLLSAVVRVREMQLADWAFRTIDASHRIRSRRLFGYQMHIDVSRTVAHRLLYLMGERYIPERTLLAQLARPGMTVVDVGANIGYYLLLFERLVGRRGRVICIEPSPENLVELRRNVDANRFTNAIVHDVAVGARTGEARLRPGLNGFITEDEGSPVRLEPLDALVDGHVDLIKIDVEGYEGHVIEGSLAILTRDRPVLFLELHPGILPRFGRSARDIVDLLQPLYPRMEAWEMEDQKRSTLPARIRARYLGTGRGLLQRSVENVVAESGSWSWDRTCWLICRPS